MVLGCDHDLFQRLSMGIIIALTQYVLTNAEHSDDFSIDAWWRFDHNFELTKMATNAGQYVSVIANLIHVE